ncbi:Transmembrane protein MGC3196-like protein, partial [Harpegnathos saltator]
LAYATIYALCSRTIRYIVLHKGGEKITLTTCNIWKKNCNIQVPINMVNCTIHRTNVGSIIPLKLKDKRFYYLLEKSGTFLNPELFDHTLRYRQYRNL